MSFSGLQEADFFGRTEELDRLLHNVDAAVGGKARSFVVSGPRGIGKTELLRQLFGNLFWKQERVVPFYYRPNPALLSATAFSLDYLTRYLCQRLAFEKKEQSLLNLEGISLDDLSTLLEDRGGLWAREILDRYFRNAGSPAVALAIALNMPKQSALATGLPTAVLIDDFDRLNRLHVDGITDPRLVSLFEAPLSFGKAPHLITGNTAELDEMPVINSLERIPVPPLGPEHASLKVRSLLRASEAEGQEPPSLLLRRLNGNAFYLSCVAARTSEKKNPTADDYWEAYAAEITTGALAARLTSVLKSYFPDVRMRNHALYAAYKILHANEPVSCERIAKALGLSEDRAEAIGHALHLAGIIQGEFGLLRPVEDNVVRDCIDQLYLREVLGKSGHELEQKFLEKSLPQQNQTLCLEMTLPMTKDAELVAAQSLEQVGKNLQLSRDAVGQMQIAVIEACINAIEHSKESDRNMYVRFVAAANQLEVSVESAGREFILDETGEPFDQKKAEKGAPRRGWGIKLMKRFVDEVRFEKTGRGTKTVLIKKLAKTAELQKENSGDRE